MFVNGYYYEPAFLDFDDTDAPNTAVILEAAVDGDVMQTHMQVGTWPWFVNGHLQFQEFVHFGSSYPSEILTGYPIPE